MHVLLPSLVLFFPPSEDLQDLLHAVARGTRTDAYLMQQT